MTYYLDYLFDDFGVFALLFLIFKVWMIIDAIQSGNDRMWYVIVFVPFGEVIYFFMFKVHDPALRSLWRRVFPKPKPSLDYAACVPSQVG